MHSGMPTYAVEYPWRTPFGVGTSNRFSVLDEDLAGVATALGTELTEKPHGVAIAMGFEVVGIGSERTTGVATAVRVDAAESV